MKSLLVTLDGTVASAAAVQWALSVAPRASAAVTGVSVVDTDQIGSDIAKLQCAQDRSSGLVRDFIESCSLKHVTARTRVLQGDVPQAISDLSIEHDATVVGFDSFGDGSCEGRFVEQMLSKSFRPLIVTRDYAKEPTYVIAACDGSVPAARTLQLFALLGLGAEAEIQLLSIHPERSVADKRVAAAARYLDLHGLSSVRNAVASTDDPAQIIAAEVVACEADLVVMGAYGHRGWRELLLGSSTTTLLAAPPTTLFVSH